MKDVHEKLDALFARYREELPDPEPSAGFTPGLWAKIDARRRNSNLLLATARRMMAAACAVTALAALLVFVPVMHRSSPTLSSTYVDVLSEQHQLMAEIDLPPGDSQ